MDRIETYYNRKDENQRLSSGRGELEFLRTKQIIEQFLPDETGLSIVDVGGGSGPYAFWLAEKGHKVAHWLSPNGVGFVAYISRFGSMFDGFISGLFEDPEYLDIVRQDLETGVHRSNKDNTRYFTDAYFHHPDEIEREAEEAHLQIVDHIAAEGVGWVWQNFDQILSNPRQRAIMLEMIDRTDRDRSLLGASGHILLVVKRRELQ